MRHVTEHGCEKCGGQIMKPQPQMVIPGGPTPPPLNKCKKCGHINDITKMSGFQCSQTLHLLLHRELNESELNQLRIDPVIAVKALSAKLIKSGKEALEVDPTTNPPTLRQKT